MKQLPKSRWFLEPQSAHTNAGWRTERHLVQLMVNESGQQVHTPIEQFVLVGISAELMPSYCNAKSALTNLDFSLSFERCLI